MADFLLSSTYDEYEDASTSSEPEQDSGYTLICQTPSSTVSLSPGGVILKSATVNRRWAPEPHDIVKEARILRRLSHVNARNLKVYVSVKQLTNDYRS